MPHAFEASFHNTKYVHGRKVMQVILEVPIERAAEVHEVIGYPDPSTSTWVAVAPLGNKQSE